MNKIVDIKTNFLVVFKYSGTQQYRKDYPYPCVIIKGIKAIRAGTNQQPAII